VLDVPDHAIDLRPETAGKGFDFADSMGARTAQMAMDALPARGSGVLPGIHNAPLKQQRAYLEAVWKSVVMRGGVNQIAKLVGINDPVILMGVASEGGQTSAGAQLFAPVPIKVQGKERAVTDVGRKRMELFCSIVGEVFGRESVARFVPVYGDAQVRENGILFEGTRNMTADEYSRLSAALVEEFGSSDIVPVYTNNGVIVVNYDPDLLNKYGKAAGEGFHRRAKKGVAEIAKMSDNFRAGGELQPVTFRADGSVLMGKGKGGANDQDFGSRISAEGSPDIQAGVADLRSGLAAVQQRCANEHGWDQGTEEAEDSDEVGGIPRLSASVSLVV
jgi:hypothetical protein